MYETSAILTVTCFCCDNTHHHVQSIKSKSENGLHELCAVSNESVSKVASADDWVQRLTAVQEILQVRFTHVPDYVLFL